jgi:putative transposase
MRLKPPRLQVTAKLRDDRVPATASNDRGSMDRMRDEPFNGARLRVLTVVDSHFRLLPGAYRRAALCVWRGRLAG